MSGVYVARYADFSAAVHKRLTWHRANSAFDPAVKVWIEPLGHGWKDTHNRFSPKEGICLSTSLVSLRFVNVYSSAIPKKRPDTLGGNSPESVAYWLVMLHRAMDYACSYAQNTPLVELLNWEHFPVVGNFQARQHMSFVNDEIAVTSSVNSSITPSSKGAAQEQPIPLPAYVMRPHRESQVDLTAMHTTAKNIAALLGKSNALRLITYASSLLQQRNRYLEQVELQSNGQGGAL